MVVKKKTNGSKNKIPIGLRVAKDVHRKLKLMAEAQKRSLANQTEYMLLKALEDSDMPTLDELAALANENWPDDEDLYDVVRKDKRRPL